MFILFCVRVFFFSLCFSFEKNLTFSSSLHLNCRKDGSQMKLLANLGGENAIMEFICSFIHPFIPHGLMVEAIVIAGAIY